MKKKEKIKKLEKKNKLLIAVVVLLSILVLIGIGMLAVKSVKKMINKWYIHCYQHETWVLIISLLSTLYTLKWPFGAIALHNS